MLKAAKVAIEYDKNHYNQFWIAGYAQFLLNDYREAKEFLRETIRLLDIDKSELVQRGPGFQERYLQALGILVEMSRVNVTEYEDFTKRYRKKYELLKQDLGWEPTPLGDWELEIQKELGLHNIS